MAEPTKRCPFCAETILAAALKCRYCREHLPTVPPTVPLPIPDVGGATGVATVELPEPAPSVGPTISPSVLHDETRVASRKTNAAFWIFGAGWQGTVVLSLVLIGIIIFFAALVGIDLNPRQDDGQSTSSPGPGRDSLHDGSSSSLPRPNALPPSLLERGASDATTKDQSDEFAPIIARLGRPEKEDSTQYDTPRPPFVTRWIEYHPENIKLSFLAGGKMGDPPPYTGWKVVGYVDMTTNTKISNTEAAERLRSRMARVVAHQNQTPPQQLTKKSQQPRRQGASPEEAAPRVNDATAPPTESLSGAADPAASAIAQQPQASSNPSQPPVVYRIGGGVSAPSVLSKVEAEYSEEARRAGWQGTVVLSLVVDDQGRPQNLKIVRALGFDLDQKAIEAVEKWRFKPGMKDGKPVSVMATIEVSFRLLGAPPGAPVTTGSPVQ